MSDEPTIGEVIRRLDSIAAQLTEVVKEIKDDRADNAKTYVRQDVYVAQQQTAQAVVADVHGDIAALRADHDREINAIKAQRTADSNFRRQVLLGFALGGVGWLLTIALFVITFTRS